MNELEFPNFDEIKVSTKTFIVVTNLQFNLENLRPPIVNLTKYVDLPRRRGRKKKIEIEDPNKDLIDGSIITIEYKDDLWGVDLKKKVKRCQLCDNKAIMGWPSINDDNTIPTHCNDHTIAGMVKITNTKKYFRNSATIVMILDGKKINFKISKNGKFQITGCKFDSHAEKIIHYTWKLIKENKNIYTMTGDHLEALYIPAMRNIDFPLGFQVNREKLDMYINMNTDYISIFEASFGYTGVNVKIPHERSLSDLVLKKVIYKDKPEVSQFLYKEYLDTLSEKEQKKKMNKSRSTTFLIFHSGKIIVSSLNVDECRIGYYKFLDIIRECEHIIREKLN